MRTFSIILAIAAICAAADDFDQNKLFEEAPEDMLVLEHEARSHISQLMQQGASKANCKNLAETMCKEASKGAKTAQESIDAVDSGKTCKDMGQKAADKAKKAKDDFKKKCNGQKGQKKGLQDTKITFKPQKFNSLKKGKCDWAFSDQYTKTKKKLDDISKKLVKCNGELKEAGTAADNADKSAKSDKKTCFCNAIKKADEAFRQQVKAAKDTQKALDKCSMMRCILAGTDTKKKECRGKLTPLTRKKMVGATKGVKCSSQPQGGKKPVPKKVNCKVSGWDKWTTCNKKCGGGMQSRKRRILIDRKNGGKKCPKHLAQRRRCNTKNCPVDCKVSAWGGWGGCNKKCGGGKKNRIRRITKQNKYGGAKCPRTKSTTVCNEKKCPVNCKVSGWGGWGRCSKKCGGGTQSRKRRIIVAPRYGGRKCQALKMKKVCNMKKCAGPKKKLLTKWSAKSGGNGGQQCNSYCPGKSYINYWKIRSGSLVDQIRGRCSNGAWLKQCGGNGGGMWSGPGDTRRIFVRAGSLIDKFNNRGGNGGRGKWLDCGAGYKIVGYKMRAKALVDSVRLKCANV